MKYLADTSALVRLLRSQASPEWADLVYRGLIAICEPVLGETLKIAESKEYLAVEEGICQSCPWATVPDGIWAMVSALRHELVPPSAYQGPSVTDLVIAATAIRLKLTVLHEDRDFEILARYVPELRQHRLSAAP